MFHDILAAVRAEVSGERALDTVRALARHHRVQASPGYDDACRWLSARIAAAGLEPETLTVPGDGRTRRQGQLMPEGWACDGATAHLLGPEGRTRLCDEAAEPLSLVLRSTPASGRYPLVVVDDGTREADYEGRDVRGRVVLTRGAVQRVHELAVVGRGAAGLLAWGRRALPPVRDDCDDPDALAYTSFWWGEGAPRGWGFVVPPRVGSRLRDRLERGESLELEVAIRARAFATPIPLLSARIPGEGPEEVLVVAHLCHPRPSANDNASGAAAALETARVLAALRAGGGFPRAGRSVRVLWVPEITGTHAWLAADPERARGIVAALNLDMVGQDQERCGSTLLIEHPPHFSASFAEELLVRIRAAALDWVTSYSGPGHYAMTRLAEVPYSGGSDHQVLVDPAAGVPCPMLIQWPDRFYHSSHDTPDKTSPESLALAVRCAATYAAFLAAAGPGATAWLTAAVGRGGRRRMLAAMDEPEPARALAREAARGERALASLARLGVPAEAIAGARERLAGFAAREGLDGGAAARAAASPEPLGGPASRVPRRRLEAPLHDQRHLLAGWEALPGAAREAWRAREAAEPGGALLCDLAWQACDGRRSIDEIANLLWLETGRHAPGFLVAFFDLTETLGLSAPAP